MSVYTTHIGCLIVNCVAGNHAKGMVAEINNYLNHNGTEWTCLRMKAMYTAALHLKNGDPESARTVYRKNSISYDKQTFLPKGEWGFAVQRFVEARRPSVIKRWAAVLRFYTCMKLQEPSERQIQKAYHAITDRYTGKATDEDIVGVLDLALQNRGLGRNSLTKMSNWREVRKRAERHHLHSTSYYYTSVNASTVDTDTWKRLQKFRKEPEGKRILSLITDPWIPEKLLINNPQRAFTEWMTEECGIVGVYAGNIHCIQEQGCKGRVVTQPSASVQDNFYPLHIYLQSLADYYFPKESCYDDQGYAAQAVAIHMSAGHSCPSIDQSSATDRFPRIFSEALLMRLDLDGYADALEEFCQQPLTADFPLNPKRTQFYYEVGQPMGLFGSFPLYHLSNMLVAEFAVMVAQAQGTGKLPFHDGTFFKVIGDDIVFSDESVAKEYTRTLEWFGVEVSPTKSFTGSVAEVAGYLIIKQDNRDAFAFRPYKVPETRYIKNPIQFLDQLGIKVTKISDKWRRIYAAYANTRKDRDIDLSPLCWKLPDDSSQEVVGKNASIMSLSNQIIDCLAAASTPLPSVRALQEQLVPDEFALQDFWTRKHIGKHLEDILLRNSDESSPFKVGNTPYSRSADVAVDQLDRMKIHHLVNHRLQEDSLLQAEMNRQGYETSGPEL